MNIKVVNDSDFSKEEKKEILEFIVKCFENINLEERRLKYFSPTYKHLLFYKNDKLISYLRMIKRETVFGGTNITIGGIGDVCTISKEREQGYALTLLKKAVEIFKEENIDIALLQTNVQKGEKLYGAVGFVPLGKAYKYEDANRKVCESEAEDAMIAPIKNKEIFEKILVSKELLDIGDGDW